MAKKDGYNPYKKKKDGIPEKPKGSVPEVEEAPQRVITERGQIIIATVLAALGFGLGVSLHFMNYNATAVTVIAVIYAANCWIAMVIKFGLKSRGATAVAVWAAIAIAIKTLLTSSFG